MPPPSQPVGHSSPHPKDYTGRVVVSHPVRAGETLESIAKIYRMPGWRPLWIYNSRVERIVGNDPNLIRRGVTILIPRSAAGYERVIRKLEATKIEVEGSVEQTEFQLEALENERAAESVKWNFIGDVATTFGSLAVRLTQAAVAARVARKTIGQAKIAARLAAHSQTEKFAKQYAAIRNQLTAQALPQSRTLFERKAALRAFVPGKIKDTGVKVADDWVQRATGREIEPFKHAKNASAARELLHKAWRGAISAGHFGLEAAEIALDYVEVSTVSDLMVACSTHERFSGITKRVTDNAKATAKQLAGHIDARIKALKEERDLLYGG